jgi:sRNA-binding carbon storage regulator CsrA
MLVLSRKEQQKILIQPSSIAKGMTVEELFADGPIEITLVQIESRLCKIGIDAPMKLNIRRDELLAE